MGKKKEGAVTSLPFFCWILLLFWFILHYMSGILFNKDVSP